MEQFITVPTVPFFQHKERLTAVFRARVQPDANTCGEKWDKQIGEQSNGINEHGIKKGIEKMFALKKHLRLDCSFPVLICS